jgi:hypothetical protein
MHRVVGHQDQIRWFRAREVAETPRIHLNDRLTVFDLHARVNQRRDDYRRLGDR